MRCGIAGSYETDFTISMTFYSDQLSAVFLIIIIIIIIIIILSIFLLQNTQDFLKHLQDFSGLYTSLITHISQWTKHNPIFVPVVGLAELGGWVLVKGADWKQMYSVRIWLINVIVRHIITYIGLFVSFFFRNLEHLSIYYIYLHVLHLNAVTNLYYTRCNITAQTNVSS